MTDGFIKVAAAIPQVQVANTTANIEAIDFLMVAAEAQGVEIICFPELSITAYTCQDLFAQQLLLEETEIALLKALELSRNLKITSIIGLPFVYQGLLFNCAAVIQGGKLHGLVPKTYIPNYKEFYEQRWFSSARVLPSEAIVRFCGQNVLISTQQLFHLNDVTFGIELCEDLWAPIAPSCQMTLAGAELVFNLSASNDLIGKHQYISNLISNQSARCLCGYVYASCGFGESTQDLVFGGKAIVAENGRILTEAPRFSNKPELAIAEVDIDLIRAERRRNTTFSQSYGDYITANPYQIQTIETDFLTVGEGRLSRRFHPYPFVPQGAELEERCEEILCMLSQALAKRIKHTNSQNVVIGISGGLDSTLALMICTNAFDSLGISRKGIVGVTMPGFGTTNRTYNNALALMKSLGITTREINISTSVMSHFADINQDPNKHDVTFENAQARERTQILMDIANQVNGLVIGTGDFSELALGWATYNGDHMSMYAVNNSVPKTLVKHLVAWVAINIADEESKKTLLDIVDTPISPELLPADEDGNITQKTESLVGPYELHDFFLYYILRYGFRPRKIFKMAVSAFDEKTGTPHYDETTIIKWLEVFYRRFFSQQFKRSCLPDGPKIGSCSLSPRGDWRMPSDAVAREWIKECEQLVNANSASFS